MKATMMRERAPGRSRIRVLGLALVASAALVVVPGATPAQAGEIDLTPFLNNTGIHQDPAQTNADFDGGGYAYSAVALRAGDPVDGYPGVDPGEQITAGGFTFTWPNRPAGAPDNVMAFGQTIPVPETPGATKIGFLGASAQGPSTATYTLNYRYTDPSGVVQHVSVPKQVAFTDWTRGLLADSPLEQGNTVVLKSRFRGFAGGSAPVFFWTQPHVFLVSVPLDATMTLESVKLPFSAQQHLFGLSVA